jgi:imidazolonepropionase-like amidohydrolase
MSAVRRFVTLAALTIAAASVITSAQTPESAPQATTIFHLLFIGHEIGQEADTVTTTPAGRHLEADFKFVDRGTTVSLAASLDLTATGQATHLTVKGRNYRLFTSDSEVTVTAGRARVHDLTTERDVDAKAPFFPVDNYAPIGGQEALIQYWLSHDRPAAIEAPPAGVVSIASRGGRNGELERLAIDGVLWGRETAWVDVRTHQLVGLTTWAGHLPFEAIRTGYEDRRAEFVREATGDRIDDAKAWAANNLPVRSGAFAVTGATVIDGTSLPSIPNATVLIRDGRIAAVGPSASIALPAGTRTIDAAGAFVIAGLWDMHAHASQTDWSLPYLAEGVTTIRDMGGEEAFLIAIRDAIASGTAVGPRYLLAGLIDGPGPRGFGDVTASTPDEAKAIVQRYHREGFQEIKIYLETPAALVPVITAEAHRLGMTVTGHLPAGLTWQTAVENGYDGIAHMQLRGQSGSDQSKAQIGFFKAHGTVMDPTQSWNELSSRSMTQPLDVMLPGAARLPRTLRRQFDSMTGGSGASQANSLKLLKDAVDNGVPVVAGTDKGVPGLSLVREIELYVEGGMTPLEAIQSATIVPARAMKLDKDSGTIAVGKRADLVILSANPLEKIANIRTAKFVVANGRLYDCATLWKAAAYR